MGRGLGPVQRQVVDILLEASTSEGLTVGRLRTLAGGDKSNLRRIIRTLARRKLIEQVTVGGERRVSLTFSGALATMPRLSRKPDPIADLRAEWKEEERRIREARAQKRRRLEVEAASQLTPELREEIWANRDALLFDVLLVDALRYLSERYVEGADLSVLSGPEDEISAAYLGDWSSYRRAVRGYVQAGLAEFERAKRSAA